MRVYIHTYIIYTYVYTYIYIYTVYVNLAVCASLVQGHPELIWASLFVRGRVAGDGIALATFCLTWHSGIGLPMAT